MTRLSNYLTRLETVLLRRNDIIVESLYTKSTPQSTSFFAKVRFFDGSRLSIGEELEEVLRQSPNRLRYRFHYQTAEGELVFRYDNAPHYPYLRTHPHHKHTSRQVMESNAPDLTDVLREIDAIIHG